MNLLITVALLMSMTVAVLEDKCTEISKIKPADNNTPPAKPNLKAVLEDANIPKQAVEANSPFVNSVVVKLSIDGAEKLVLVKIGPRLAVTEEYANTQYLFFSGTEEDKLLFCQYDNEFTYIVKSIAKTTDMCQALAPRLVAETEIKKMPVFKLVNGKISGGVDLLVPIFPKLKKLGEGGFGIVRELPIDKGKPIALKAGNLAEIGVTELKAMIAFGSSKYGSGFRGCFYDEKISAIFIGQDMLTDSLNDKPFLDKYIALPPKSRIAFMIMATESLVDFEKTGYVHNDIKPENVMVDAEGKPHLIDFGYARLKNTAENYSGTRMYFSPMRQRADIVSPHFDVYSLMVTFMGIESGWGHRGITDIRDSGVVAKDDDYPKLPKPTSKVFVFDEDVPKMEANYKEDHFETQITKILVPKWGPVNDAETNIKKMNFSTLAYWIIVGLKKVTPAQLLEELKRIEAETKRLAMRVV